jgi:putative two-component system response regulator
MARGTPARTSLKRMGALRIPVYCPQIGQRQDSMPDMGTGETLEERLKKAVILIVDDEPFNVATITAMLTDEGFNSILSTTDSRQVVPLFEAHQPDIVLLDLRMPQPDGFGVLKLLQCVEHEGFLSVIVLSGVTDRESRLRALAGGARDFIGMPFDKTELIMRIRSVLEVRLLQRELNSQNAVLERRVRERTRELEESQLEVVKRLADAAERRDSYTGSHISRMRMYCRVLGRAAGFPERACDLLQNASLMHDVGKIAMPDSILLKPGPLTPEERAVIQTHTTIGGEMLAGGTSDLLKMGRVIALTHHERWDGKGYPAGLEGEGIPAEGRLCALADVFDALTSDRCYRKAWPAKRAVEEIGGGAGTQFDPVLTAVFLRVVPALEDIRNGAATEWR